MKRLLAILCITTTLAGTAFAQSGEMLERGLTPGAGLMDMKDPAHPVPIANPAAEPAATPVKTPATPAAAKITGAPVVNAAPVATTPQVNAFLPPQLPKELFPKNAAPPLLLNSKRMPEQDLPKFEKIPPMPAGLDKAKLAKDLAYNPYIVREWNDHYDAEFYNLYNAKLAQMQAKGQGKCLELTGGLWRDVYVGARKWSVWEPTILEYIANHNSLEQLYTANQAISHFYTGEGYAIVRDAIANVKIDPSKIQPNAAEIMAAAAKSVNERNPGCNI